MRDTIIFSGTSHTFGLGLEFEFHPDLNDDNWLKENGVNIPLPRLDEYREIWKKYRWSKLVCDKLNYIEYNIHDNVYVPPCQLKPVKINPNIGGNAVETIWNFDRGLAGFENILNRTKYVILEMSYVRWWDKNLHGMGEKEYPTTASEISDLLSNPNSDMQVVREALDWLNKLDNKLYWKETYKKYQELVKNNPEIKFLLLPWYGEWNNIEDFILNTELQKNIIPLSNFKTVNNYLNISKLKIDDVAKAFNGNYIFNKYDGHASSKAQEWVAEQIIKFIKKLEENEQRF